MFFFFFQQQIIREILKSRRHFLYGKNVILKTIKVKMLFSLTLTVLRTSVIVSIAKEFDKIWYYEITTMILEDFNKFLDHIPP